MKTAQPRLEAARLNLIPLTADDAPEVQRMAGNRKIAEMTENIPHPYPEGAAEAWIAMQPSAWRLGEAATYGIFTRDTSTLVGCVGLVLCMRHLRASLGYWVGVEYWGRGYCTEAAGRLVDFGFNELQLNRIEAAHLSRNPASGRVMQKIGMRHEGTMKRYIKENEQYLDSEIYAVLRLQRE